MNEREGPRQLGAIDVDGITQNEIFLRFIRGTAEGWVLILTWTEFTLNLRIDIMSDLTWNLTVTPEVTPENVYENFRYT